MAYQTIANDQYDRLRHEIQGLRDEIHHQRRRVDLMLDYALAVSMALVVVMLVVVSFA